MAAFKVLYLGMRECRECKADARLCMIQTNVDRALAVKLLVCQRCDRNKGR